MYSLGKDDTLLLEKYVPAVRDSWKDSWQPPIVILVKAYEKTHSTTAFKDALLGPISSSTALDQLKTVGATEDEMKAWKKQLEELGNSGDSCIILLVNHRNRSFCSVTITK